MKNQVTVTVNSKTGKVVTMKSITNKETGEVSEVGFFRVESKALSNLGRIGRVSTRSAIVTLDKEAIDFAVESGQLFDGAKLDGKIVIEETLKPYSWVDAEGNSRTQEPKINPSTKQVITHDGKPVYRNSRLTQDLSEQDVLLKSDSSLSDDSNNAEE